MTRARGFALAVLLSVCCLGQASAFAQYGPPGPPPNGYSVYPNGGPDPACPPENCYGTTDEVEASINRFGPRAIFSGRTLRVEYLNYDIGKPGDGILGAPVAGVPNAGAPFPVFTPGGTVPFAMATVPTTDQFHLTSMSGVQVTAAWDFIEGNRLEVSGFMLAKRQTGYTLALGQPFDTATIGFGGPPFGLSSNIVPVDVATSTLSNGSISDHLFLYNQSYSATFTSQLWGGEANYLWGDSVDLIQFLPLAGARYLNLTEDLTQVGVFQDTFIGGPPVSTQIGSHTINNLWGGQIGFRTQVVTKWFEFGVTPKLLMLGNTAVSQVYAARFRSNTDPTVYNEDMTTRFTFGTDVGAFATVHIAPNFSVRGGYNILWINQVTRPHKDIVYNDNGPAAPAGIGQQTVFHDIFINGFTFGAELRW